MYSGKLGGRDEDPDDGRGGSGEVAVAKSMVATSSEFWTGIPQEGQKRALPDRIASQEEHFAIFLPIQHTAGQ
jgi:hypothetical protein